MEDVNRYFNLIKHNVNLLDLLTGDRSKHLKDEDFSDWQVTVIFYISCIYMKTVCSLFDIDIQDHYTLHSMINTRKELPCIRYQKIIGILKRQQGTHVMKAGNLIKTILSKEF